MEEHKKWWHSAVIYQIYPKSFQDSNGDGIGDLQGILSRLDYLVELGIDAIWLSPVCRSPQADNGYDISDYQDIDPMFGTLEDMDALFAAAKKRNIRILIDLVLNHTSDQHIWFQEACKSRDNPYHEYYIWRDGEAGTPPNDLKALFGGSSWEWVPHLRQYYFHRFAVQQPDLNWKTPALRHAIYEMIRWWMDRGAGGFRLDVIDQIAKEPDLKINKNGPMLHTYIREMNRATFGQGDYITVGETWGADVPLARQYSAPDGSEFSMVFQFEHDNLDRVSGGSKWDLAPLDFMGLKEVFGRWQTGLHGSGWNSSFWNNHDLPRILSRWGNDGVHRVESAKMLATLLHGLQGTPYIYQGEELGMTNIAFPSIDQYRDIDTLNYYHSGKRQGIPHDTLMAAIYAKSRDNGRTPMQWDATIHGGFSSAQPWLASNPNYVSINAANQVGDSNSIFSHYRALIRLRKEHPVFVGGDFAPLFAAHTAVFAYRRTLGDTALVVVCNFFAAACALPALPPLVEGATLLLSNYDADGDVATLRPYEARIYLATGE